MTKTGNDITQYEEDTPEVDDTIENLNEFESPEDRDDRICHERREEQ